MNIHRAILLMALIAILLAFIISTPITNGQNGQPDFVSLDSDSTPNVLLIEMQSLQTDADGVELTFTVSNPLRTLYLAFEINGDYTALQAASSTDQDWYNIGVVPPNTTLTYRIHFDSTDQAATIHSHLISSNALTFNWLEIANQHFAGDIETATLVEAFLDNTSEAEQVFAAMAQNSTCLASPTIGDIDDCVASIRILFDDHRFQDMVINILSSARLPISPNDVADLLASDDFADAWSNLADSLIYFDLTISSDEALNRYQLQPFVLDSTLPSLWPPRLMSPVGFAFQRQPHFAWNPVPDINFYELQVDDDPTFASPAPQIRTPNTYFDSPLLLEPNTIYYWRVRAINNNVAEPSPWSTASFITGTTDPSAGLIAYRDDNEQVWIAFPDSNSPRQLPIQSIPGCPDFSPDGGYLAYAHNDFRQDIDELVLLDLVTNESQVLLENWGGRYDWSPDSTQIAFTYGVQADFSSPDTPFIDPQGVWTLDISTGDIQPLIEPFSFYPFANPTWSPDGTRIAFREVEYIEGAQPFRITTLDGQISAWEQPVGHFDWSPDGTQIVFDEATYGPTSGLLFTDNMQNSNMDPIVDEERFFVDGPVWSPNGQQIVFRAATVSGPEGGREHSLWLVNPDGSNLRSIPYTPTSYIDLPIWSLDSTQLLINDSSGLKMINLDGSIALNIASSVNCVDWLSPKQTVTILDIFGDHYESLSSLVDEPPTAVDAVSPTNVPLTPTISINPTTSGPTLVPTPAATLTPANNYQCAGAPAGRLQVGQQARQSLNRDSVLIRQNFEIDRYPFEVFPGDIVDVIGGPECHPLDSGQLLLWWQIRNADGQVGWAPEGIPGRYFFEPLNTQISIPQNTQTCTGTLPSRLTVGENARVIPGTSNNVRSGTGTSFERIGRIPGGSSFRVLEGPVCAQGYAWWRVDYNGLEGWTAEADHEDYWLEPLN